MLEAKKEGGGERLWERVRKRERERAGVSVAVTRPLPQTSRSLWRSLLSRERNVLFFLPVNDNAAMSSRRCKSCPRLNELIHSGCNKVGHWLVRKNQPVFFCIFLHSNLSPISCFSHVAGEIKPYQNIHVYLIMFTLYTQPSQIYFPLNSFPPPLSHLF